MYEKESKKEKDEKETIEVVNELDKKIFSQILKIYDKTFKDLVNR